MESNKPFDEMKSALAKAWEINKVADNASSEMAQMLIGRLRHVSKYMPDARKKILGAIKRELQDFNVSTGKWK